MSSDARPCRVPWIAIACAAGCVNRFAPAGPRSSDSTSSFGSVNACVAPISPRRSANRGGFWKDSLECRREERPAGGCPRLPVSGEPDAGQQLPFLSELLGLRARGARTARFAARELARCEASLSLPAVSSGRLRPGSRSNRTLNPASPRASRIRFTARITVDQEHGYATPDPVAHLLLFGADAVAGLGARSQPAGRAGGRSRAACRRSGCS